jgi:hypothetical protein
MASPSSASSLTTCCIRAARRGPSLCGRRLALRLPGRGQPGQGRSQPREFAFLHCDALLQFVCVRLVPDSWLHIDRDICKDLRWSRIQVLREAISGVTSASWDQRRSFPSPSLRLLCPAHCPPHYRLKNVVNMRIIRSDHVSTGTQCVMMDQRYANIFLCM